MSAADGSAARLPLSSRAVRFRETPRTADGFRERARRCRRSVLVSSRAAASAAARQGRRSGAAPPRLTDAGTEYAA